MGRGKESGLILPGAWKVAAKSLPSVTLSQRYLAGARDSGGAPSPTVVRRPTGTEMVGAS